jgi:hypothetical protein
MSTAVLGEARRICRVASTPLQLRHANIHHGDIRLVLPRQFHRLDPGGCFRYDREFRPVFEYAPEPIAKEPMIVRNQDADCRRHF